MTRPVFTRLNDGWNAEPNAPNPRVSVEGARVLLSFILNPWAYEAEMEEGGRLTFERCARWRLGSTNDEGWYRGQCRYSAAAPAWGEFYEISGDDPQRLEPSDWHVLAPLAPAHRHFLLYFRDETFECLAQAWRFARDGAGPAPDRPEPGSPTPASRAA